MRSLLRAQKQRVQGAHQKHLAFLLRRVVEEARVQIRDHQRGETVIVVLVDHGEVIAHAIPVLRVEARLADIQAVCRLLHVLRRRRLPRDGADVFAEQHRIGTQDLVAHPRPIARLGVHNLIIVLLRFVALLEAQDRLIEFSVDPWMRHRSHTLPGRQQRHHFLCIPYLHVSALCPTKVQQTRSRAGAQQAGAGACPGALSVRKSRRPYPAPLPRRV